jgi:hypothetical protein
LYNELRQLRQQVGNPSLDTLSDHAHRAWHPVGTLGGLLNNKGTPRRTTVEAFVAGCADYARTRPSPVVLSAAMVDIEVWRARYDAAYPDTATSVDKSFAAACGSGTPSTVTRGWSADDRSWATQAPGFSRGVSRLQ